MSLAAPSCATIVPLRAYQPYVNRWRPLRAGIESLGRRELQVVGMLATARTPKQIATELSISEKTVWTHWYRVKEKLNIPNVATLVHFALARGLVTNLYANEPNG